VAAEKKITQKAIDGMPKVGDKLLGDGGGLYLRSRNGKKSWIFRYVSPLAGTDVRPKIDLGKYPAIGVDEARELALPHRRQVELGLDPKAEKHEKALLQDLGETPRTIRELYNHWRENFLATSHADGGLYVARALEKHMLPALGGIKLETLRTQHVVAVLDKMHKAGLGRTCGVVLSNTRQMLGYAMDTDWLAVDCTARLVLGRWDGKGKSGERFLLLDEIKNLAEKVPRAELAPDLQYGIWIVLACGTRGEETTLTRLRHVNLKEKTWLLPAPNQKKVRGVVSKDFTIELSDFAVRQFARLIAYQKAHAIEVAEKRTRRTGNTHEPVPIDFLFPARRLNEGHVNEKTLPHAITDRQRLDGKPLEGRNAPPLAFVLEAPVIIDGETFMEKTGHWTAHDLRRTMSTQMVELGVRPDIADRCQNHKEPNKIRKVYQHAELRVFMRDGWQTWGEKLTELTGL